MQARKEEAAPWAACFLGSSPSEGSAKSLQVDWLAFRTPLWGVFTLKKLINENSAS
jgi:hypothetical protein